MDYLDKNISEQATTLQSLEQALINLDDCGSVKLVELLLAKKIEPVAILTVCERALAIIGERYASGEYYISGLIMAGEIMSCIAELVTPYMLIAPKGRTLKGRILIGTVEGDIHDLGKNIAGVLLAAHGFNVCDLGADVPLADYIAEYEKFNPDIIGISVLLSTCFPSLQKIVAGLNKMRHGKNIPAIFISGAQITVEHCKMFGADYYSGTAVDTVLLCKKIIDAIK